MASDNNAQQLKNIVEAVLLAADKPMKVVQIEAVFAGDANAPTRDEIRKAIAELAGEYEGRGFELKEVASGFRIQVRQDYSDWVGRLWEEKPQRYTRALLETLALIAYRQPITRGEIEEVRGVSVSSNIIKTLLEREWVKVLGHKDVPGKPALYGTTKQFLDYFNLKSLNELPSLAELKDLDKIFQELDLDMDRAPQDESTGSEDTQAGLDETAQDEPGQEDLEQDGLEQDGLEQDGQTQDRLDEDEDTDERADAAADGSYDETEDEEEDASSMQTAAG